MAKEKPGKPDILFEVSNDLGDHFVGQVGDTPGTQAELKKLFKSAGAVPDTDQSLSQIPAAIAKRILSSRDKSEYRFRIEKEWDKNEDLEPDSDFEPEETDNDEILENNEVLNDWPKQYRYGYRY